MCTAIALWAGALLTAAMTTASATQPAPGTAAAQTVARQSEPVLVDCLWHAHVHPADFILACGDANSRLAKLHWSRWGSNSATAEGVNAVNDCKPYCAAGTFRSYAVTVRLDRPQAWKKHPEVQHYTRMTLTFTDNRPDGFTRVVTYPLWD